MDDPGNEIVVHAGVLDVRFIGNLEFERRLFSNFSLFLRLDFVFFDFCNISWLLLELERVIVNA